MSLSVSSPTLYVKRCPASQWARVLLAEKGNPVSIVEATPSIERGLGSINVDQIYPILLDRSIVVYGPPLEDYIHERWPGPELLPPDAVKRAQARMLTTWIRDHYTRDGFERRRFLREVEDSYDPANTYFFGHHVTTVDLALIPLLRSVPYQPVSTAFVEYLQRLTKLNAAKAAA